MATKTAYQCDADGVFTNSVFAFESPLEPGVFHLPAGCTFTEPPAVSDRQAAVWADGAWTVVTDRRGETWYRGRTPVVVDFLGDPSAMGLAETTPAPSVDDLRSAKIAAIVAAADALLAAGAPVTDGLHVALDDGSRADLTAMAATATAAIGSGLPWPESYARGWIAVENVRIPLPLPHDGLAVAASVGNFYAAVIQHRRDLKDAALAAEDAAELDAIDANTGWPA